MQTGVNTHDRSDQWNLYVSLTEKALKNTHAKSLTPADVKVHSDLGCHVSQRMEPLPALFPKQ